MTFVDVLGVICTALGLAVFLIGGAYVASKALDWAIQHLAAARRDDQAQAKFEKEHKRWCAPMEQEALRIQQFHCIMCEQLYPLDQLSEYLTPDAFIEPGLTKTYICNDCLGLPQRVEAASLLDGPMYGAPFEEEEKTQVFLLRFLQAERDGIRDVASCWNTEDEATDRVRLFYRGVVSCPWAPLEIELSYLPGVSGQVVECGARRFFDARGCCMALMVRCPEGAERKVAAKIDSDLQRINKELTEACL